MKDIRTDIVKIDNVSISRIEKNFPEEVKLVDEPFEIIRKIDGDYKEK